MPKTAIILGATGSTGTELLNLLLSDDRYGSIKLFSRHSANVSHPKVEEHLIDLFKLEDYAADFTGDVVFCCIGTTKAKTPDEDTYRKIDYGIPVAAARLAMANNIPSFIVISAIGVRKDSRFFYNRTKAEMQEAVLAQHIDNTYILQPSLIIAARADNRLGEKIGAAVMTLLNPLLWGNLAKYRSIKAGTIAKAMAWLDNKGYEQQIITSDKIDELGR
jgi:uncharacterized protein YbjT (DUF2867 family)